jgi:glucose-1-phosphate thymidylyltransferase
MKGVILAAGRGERLAPMGWDKPKCLLEFGEQTLLDNIINALLENGIDRLVVVVGYKQELVIEALTQHPVSFEVVVNEDFAQTNTIHSLYLTREHLNEDFIYFNADVNGS